MKRTSIIKHYRYFHNLLGERLYVLQILTAIAGLFDGLGLIMFIPLLSIASDAKTTNAGKLQFIFDGFSKLGIEYSLRNVLLLMILFFFLKAIVLYIKSLYAIKTRQQTVRKIRFGLMDGLNFLSYNGFTHAEPGEIQHTMTKETNTVVSAMVNFTSTLQSAIILFVYIGLAFATNWRFALMVILGGLLTSVIYNFINKTTVKKTKEISILGAKFNKHLIQVIQNFKYLKVTNLLETYNNKLKDTINNIHEERYKLGKLYAIIGVIKEPITVVIITLVILIYVDGLKYPLEGIILSLLLFYRSLGYLMMLQTNWNYFLKDAVSIEIVGNLQNYFLNHSDTTKKSNQRILIENIALDNATVKYHDKAVLKNISISIPSKQTIALVGESGAGKTTLANVLSGLVPPTTGELIINGKKLPLAQLYAYRNSIGYITQEPVIFNDTIYNNITFWDKKTPENITKFNHCLQLAHLNDFVQTLDQKENAPLGSNGILVSGGQKQRVSIARELYRNVDLLIMDEATSALDTKTENIIKSNIDSLKGKYTMVIIAHRLSTIKNVDIIYLMHEGEITASGNYTELYRKSKKFKQMIDLQEL